MKATVLPPRKKRTKRRRAAQSDNDEAEDIRDRLRKRSKRIGEVEKRRKGDVRRSTRKGINRDIVYSK